jgi:hypothetical protein
MSGINNRLLRMVCDWRKHIATVSVININCVAAKTQFHNSSVLKYLPLKRLRNTFTSEDRQTCSCHSRGRLPLHELELPSCCCCCWWRWCWCRWLRCCFVTSTMHFVVPSINYVSEVACCIRKYCGIPVIS